MDIILPPLLKCCKKQGGYRSAVKKCRMWNSAEALPLLYACLRSMHGYKQINAHSSSPGYLKPKPSPTNATEDIADVTKLLAVYCRPARSSQLAVKRVLCPASIISSWPQSSDSSVHHHWLRLSNDYRCHKLFTSDRHHFLTSLNLLSLGQY